MTQRENPLGTKGFEFMEYAHNDLADYQKDFAHLGFDVVGRDESGSLLHMKQNQINFILNAKPGTHAADFASKHGKSVSAMGFYVEDASLAFEKACARGAKAYDGQFGEKTFDLPAIYGIGESLVYFIDDGIRETLYSDYFTPQTPTKSHGVGLNYLDHVTHNVYRGNMDTWADFYINIFNFFEIRTFDIKGLQTGLISRAMSSPCGRIVIPLNEATDDDSQIEEYLREYKGEGIQHIALGTKTIYDSVEAIRANGIDFLSVPDTYFRLVPDRVPGHEEDLERMQKNKILIDGSMEKDVGILLQIFTKNVLGPVFFEIIQRKGNKGFGEGNFQALFESIELDQIERGVLPST